VSHDRDYWFGGPKREREASDLRLKWCIEDTGWNIAWKYTHKAKSSRIKIHLMTAAVIVLVYHYALSRMMWVGVRIGGVGWLPTPFRWGYGWKYPQTKP